MKHPSRVFFAAVFFAAGCESTVTSTVRDAVVDSPDVVVSDAPLVEDIPPAEDVPSAEDVRPASGIGGACSATGFPQQGNCARGQICIPSNLGGGVAWRGGYCTQACGLGSRCPADAFCSSLQGFPVCLKRCTSAEDCRRMEGYVCVAADATGNRVCRINDEPVGARDDGSACFTRGGAHPAPALARSVFQGANVNVSTTRTDSDLEAEGNIVVSPRNGTVAVSYIAIQGGFGGTTSFMGVSRSMNGAMWTGDGVVRDPQFNSSSDPVLAYTPDGVLHMTFIGLNRNNFGQVSAVHVRVTESADDGRTWSAARQVDPDGYCAQGTGGICDKPWITSGPGVTDGTTSLYLAYLRSSRNAVGLVAHRSDDNGMTWAAPVALGSISGTPTSSNQPNLATIATGPRGEVGFAWVTVNNSLVDGMIVDGRNGSDQNRILFRRSTDGLRSTQSSVVVSRPTDSPVFVQPQVAIDGETVHVAYVSGTPNAAWDIVLATSRDSGRSWSHRKVNDDPETCATHHWPQLVVDPMTHSAHLIWLENRFGEGQVVYARCPNDPATRCGANERVSDDMGAFRFTTSRQPNVWHGDYVGLTLTPDGSLWATWSDTRAGAPAMYAARGRARP